MQSSIYITDSEGNRFKVINTANSGVEVRGEGGDKHIPYNQLRFYTPELNIGLITEAMKDKSFHLDPLASYIIDCSVKQGYCYRSSVTQAGWLDEGLAKARKEAAVEELKEYEPGVKKVFFRDIAFRSNDREVIRMDTFEYKRLGDAVDVYAPANGRITPQWCVDILNQLTGNRGAEGLKSMIGTSQIVRNDDNNGRYIAFRFMDCGAGRPNFCKIELIADLYTVTFSRVRGSNVKEISKHEGIYCDELQDLFESVTGLYTHL